ncbi:hypothetical protein CA13_52670 [Planctomycetes bacterium CA13]|uniref:Uncharacterized protein n=1 Tax=Novipirellula herctigrandis TaxID=2527986 RepID=A0A5C5Z9M6_9BACT|nr:hypothetical protein CA13_52670 [Planctomycetes bacterium CA13]
MFQVGASHVASAQTSVYQFNFPIAGTLNGSSENGKPVARPGRKATDLYEMAGLPKKLFPFSTNI